MDISLKKYRTPYYGASIRELLIHLDVWRKESFWEKLILNYIIKKDDKRCDFTYYNKEEGSQNKMIEHLKRGRSRGAILAILDLNLGK